MRSGATIVAALAVVACAGAGSQTTSGLRGIVLRGPVTPVCVEGVPCDRPAPGVVLVFKRSGRVVGRAETSAGGRYAVRLRRGWYAVTTPSARIGTQLTPRVVRVPGDRVARVDFHLDTGIR